MPNYSGVWTLQEQYEAILEGNWTGISTPILFSWGESERGETGQNVNLSADISSPTQVGTESGWEFVAKGNSQSHAAAIRDGALYMWGLGTNGSLGQNDTISRSSPVQVGALTNWASVTVGDQLQTLAIKTDGTLWGWGSNNNGLLGLNEPVTANKSSPVQVGSDTNWSQVSSQQFSMIALKTDGTMWTCGNGSYGEVGDNVRVDRSSPVQVGASETWAFVESGSFNAFAITTSGELYSWGASGAGRLGHNTNTYRSSPTQVGALTNWSTVNSAACTLAIKTDGTLWGWGNNSSGEIGDNTAITKSSPVQIGAETNWIQVNSAHSQSFGIDSDQKLYSWGYGRFGATGQNTSGVILSSPTQVGALTGWTSVGGGQYFGLAIFNARTGMS